jgi:hypothetical protein
LNLVSSFGETGFEVLLSFTNRSRVHSVQKAFERFDGSQWISIGGDHRDFPAIGQVRCNPMRGLVGGVAGFIDWNLGKLMIDEKPRRKV